MKIHMCVVAWATGSILLILGACGGGGGGSPPPLPGDVVGDGTFAGAGSFAVSAGDKPTALAAADFNSDGKLDLAIGAHLGDAVRVALGAGDGTFSVSTSLSLPANSRIFDLKSGDINLDGRPDLVAACSGSNEVRVWLGATSGTFLPANTVVLSGANEVHGVALGDINADGFPDLVASARTPGIVSARLGDGQGGFAAASVGGDLVVGFGARQVVLADLNIDFKLDIVTAVFDSGQLAVHLGVGDGSFVAAPGSPVAVSGTPWNLYTRDFNLDGLADIAAPGASAGIVNIMLGTGTGGFVPSAQSPLAVGLGPIGIAGGSLDEDGLDDLVVADFSDAKLYVVLSSGLGTFNSAGATPLGVGLKPYATVTADLNGDGVLDLATANQDSDSVSVFLGNISAFGKRR